MKQSGFPMLLSSQFWYEVFLLLLVGCLAHSGTMWHHMLCAQLFCVQKNTQNVFHHPSHTLVKLFLKLGIALLIEPAENCSTSSPVRLLIQKLFWALDEDFKIASCVAPQTWYLHGIQIWRIIRWPLFFFNHFRTVLVQASLRDACNARRAHPSG